MKYGKIKHFFKLTLSEGVRKLRLINKSKAKIVVELISPQGNTLQFPLVLNDLPITRRWLKALDFNLKSQVRIRDRFVGFGRTHHDAVSDLTKAIQTIEAYSPRTIAVDPRKPIEREELNILHRHFEDMIGSVENISPFYLNAPPDVRMAISDLNTKVHEIEALTSPSMQDQIYVAMDNVTRFPMNDEDYIHFELKQSFGDVLLHYAQLGKQVFDVYLDKDEHVSDENIRPLKYITGEFDLNFGTNHPVFHLEPFKAWLQKNNFAYDNPKLAIGWLKIGSVDFECKAFKGLSEKEIISKISQYPKVKTVEIIGGI